MIGHKPIWLHKNMKRYITFSNTTKHRYELNKRYEVPSAVTKKFTILCKELINAYRHFGGSGFPLPDKYRHFRGIWCFYLLRGFFYLNEWRSRSPCSICTCLPHYTMLHSTRQRSSLLTLNEPTEGYSQLSAHLFCAKGKTLPHSAQPQLKPGI